MVQKVTVLILLLGIMVTVVHTKLFDLPQAISPTFVLGFLLLAAYCSGQILEIIRLPKITGYILAGLVFGPYVLGLTSQEAVQDLTFINSLALAFIAFCAGGELKASNLKTQISSIINLVVSQTFVVFVGTSAIVFLLVDYFSLFEGTSMAEKLIIALIFGIISVARSPSSTIAIISETKSKGNYTDIVLSVTIVIDVAVIILFGIVVSVGKAIIVSSASVDWLFFLILLFELMVALALGFLLGKGLIYLIEKVKVEFPIVIIGIGFLIIKFSHEFTAYFQEIHDIAINLEPLLICMAAGYTVQNHSDFGKRFLVKMDSISLPIYIVFFAITGASINIDILKTAWIFGLIIVGVRLLMLYTGSFVSGKMSKDSPLHYHNYWLGFITQAGVSLGLLTEIVRRFPSIGISIQTLLIASITINQLIGPIAFKWALNRVGDSQQKRMVN